MNERFDRSNWTLEDYAMDKYDPTEEEIVSLMDEMAEMHPDVVSAIAGENTDGYPTALCNIMSKKELNRLAALDGMENPDYEHNQVEVYNRAQHYIGIEHCDQWLPFNGMDMGEAIAVLSPYVKNENIKKIFYDSKKAMHLFDGINGPYGDVMLAEYLLEAGGNEISEDKTFERYNAKKGAAALIYVHNKQEKALESKQLTSLYSTMELPLARVLFEMEKIGFYVDGEALNLLGNELSLRITELQKQIYFLAGREFNINSPAQLGEVLFTELKLPPIKKTKRGYSTDNDVLEALDHPIIEPIMAYRQLQKLKSTYIDGMYGLVSQKDGRIHSTFKQAVTATGRISSTEPNLQNIPVRYEEGRAIRKAFLAEKEGFVLVNADYSQIELRILAHLSGDETLINSFKNNEDIHARTAAEVFGVDISEVTSHQRSQAKAVNFGIVYGISDFGLSKSIGSTRKEAALFMEKYFERYPKVEAYLKESVQQAKMCGYARTVMGRRREIPELRAQNYNVRSFGERVAMNAPIQGSA
ncbi:MAG: DNA polymerase I, partial [Clostridia bacterium]|nr:DNA polymerase I [Clostridia bacterium]